MSDFIPYINIQDSGKIFQTSKHLLVTDNVSSNKFFHYFIGATIDWLNTGVHKSSDGKKKEQKGKIKNNSSERTHNQNKKIPLSPLIK